MKKFLVIIAVLALTMVSSVAMAEVTMDGSIEFLMRSFKNTDDWNDKVTGLGDYQNTYSRMRLGMNAKTEGAKGRIQLDTDWDQWGDGAAAANTASSTANPGFETRPNGTFAVREGWLDFGLGFGTAHIKVGRQFLQLGNGWFLQSRKYGSDAWLLGMPGKNTIAFVNIKASENNSTLADDTDAYALLDTFKIDDNNTVGAYWAMAKDRRGTWTNNALASAWTGTTAPFAQETNLTNIGLHYSGKVGPVKLQAEVDFQMGDVKLLAGGDKPKFKGKQFVFQGQLPMDALTLNATIASGSGNKENGKDVDQYMNFLDKDPRYTAVYEYVMKTAAGAKNTGFANTQAIGLGGAYKLSKMFSFNLDFWMLTANEKVALNGGATPSDDLGTEIDFRVTANITDQVSWYVNFGQFLTGKAYEDAAGKADAAQAIQSVLSYKF